MSNVRFSGKTVDAVGALVAAVLRGGVEQTRLFDAIEVNWRVVGVVVDV